MENGCCSDLVEVVADLKDSVRNLDKTLKSFNDAVHDLKGSVTAITKKGADEAQQFKNAMRDLVSLLRRWVLIRFFS